MTALRGLRIVEIAERVTGEYAARLLADFGAEVIKVEPPGGAPTRALGPFHKGESTLFAWLNTNKRSVVLDLDQADDRTTLDRLLAGADALIDDHRPEWAAAHTLSPADIARDHRALVHCAITPFGQSAPADWQIARPINVMQAGGWGYHTPGESPPDKPPLKGPGRFLSDFEAGLDAALCVAASLWRKRRTGLGQFIDISEVATQVSRADSVIGRALAGDVEPGPERTRYDMGGPGASFPCSDGHIFLLMTTSAHWKGLCALMGDPEWANAFPGDWLEFHCSPDRVALFRRHFAAWAAEQLKEPISEAAQRLGVPLVAVNTASDVRRNPQYAHRGYFQELAGVTYPTMPYRLSASPVRVVSPAPGLGADQMELG